MNHATLGPIAKIPGVFPLQQEALSISSLPIFSRVSQWWSPFWGRRRNCSYEAQRFRKSLEEKSIEYCNPLTCWEQAGSQMPSPQIPCYSRREHSLQLCLIFCIYMSCNLEKALEGKSLYLQYCGRKSLMCACVGTQQMLRCEQNKCRSRETDKN